MGKHTNLLILSLGLTYVDNNTEDFIPFKIFNSCEKETNEEKHFYFYYDIQDAAYK